MWSLSFWTSVNVSSSNDADEMCLVRLFLLFNSVLGPLWTSHTWRAELKVRMWNVLERWSGTLTSESSSGLMHWIFWFWSASVFLLVKSPGRAFCVPCLELTDTLPEVLAGSQYVYSTTRWRDCLLQLKDSIVSVISLWAKTSLAQLQK